MNVAVANFYQLYKIFNDYVDEDISKKTLINEMIKVMKLLIPFTPHLAHECLELLKCKDTNKWPEVDQKDIIEEIKIAIQVNGKTRDIITVKKDLDENDLDKLVKKNQRLTNTFLTKELEK